MGYEKVQGDQLFDGQVFHGNHMVLIRDTRSGKTSIVAAAEAGEDIQYVPGLIRPGFVNAHCHLELSHMKGVIPKHTGLVPFLKAVVSNRSFPESEMNDAMQNALEEMKADGIVAVGDISNSSITVPYKRSSGMHFQNFIEVLSFSEANTPARLAHYQQVLDQFIQADLQPSNLTPHAPYSVSATAFEHISKTTANQIVSIHNQETRAEDELFRTGGGDFLQLFEQFGISESPFRTTGVSSLRSYLPYFNHGQSIILVHNTYTSREDIDWAMELATKRCLKLFCCLCPNANLYIENRLPDLLMLRDSGIPIVIGTDSYSSNDQLTISSELAVIHQHFPDIPTEDIYRWATVNGAAALGIEPVWVSGLPLVQSV
ncbi:MAG: amidohydrolase family protein [Chitinophagaceae bacterium]